MKQQTTQTWPATLYLTTECFSSEDFLMTEAEMLRAIHELNTDDPHGNPLTLDHCERLEFDRARADNTAALYNQPHQKAIDAIWLKVENPALTCWPSGSTLAAGLSSGVGPDAHHFYDPEDPEDVKNFEA